MKNSFLTLLLFASVLQVGCSKVYIDKPIGEAWNKKQQSQLLGRWSIENDESSIYEVQRNKAGELVFAVLFWEADKQKFTMNQGLITVTHVGENDFAFIDIREAVKAANKAEEKADGKEEEPIDGLIPCKIDVKEGNLLELTYFKTKALAKAILDSKLPGKVINQDSDATEVDDPTRVLLSAADSEIADLFRSPEVMNYLDQKSTITWKRLNAVRATR